MHVLLESLFEFEVAHLVTTCIVVQQTIEANTLYAGYETASRRVGLQTATSSNAYHGKGAMLGLLLAGVIIDVGKGVEFVSYDIDIVATYTVALNGDTLTFIHTCDGVELAARNLALLRVEVCCNSVNTGRIAYQYHLVGQLFWLEMQMETRTISIDNQFGFWKTFFHRLMYLMSFTFYFCITCGLVQLLYGSIELQGLVF